MRIALATLLALAGAAGIAALSGVPYAAEPAQHAVIRLAWRARGERDRRCRHLSPEELAKLPAHMRQEEVCERRILPYRLRVAVDDVTVVNEEVRAGGASADRPLFVFRDLAVSPGMHALSITFERETITEHSETEEEEDHYRETPPRLTLDDSVRVSARSILLVTYDDERQRLRLLAAPAARR